MLFMGEEWAASTPWQFFSDHEEPALAAAVRAGRQREFADHGWSPEELPDPQDPDTFARSKLDWAEHEREPHASMLEWYGALVRLRRERPELTDSRLDRVRVDYDEDSRWLVVHRHGLRVVCNLAGVEQVVPLDGPVREVLLASGVAEPSGPALRLDPETVAVVVCQA
jgi:maltooligosyltrehalose trehalohydrolase